MENEATKNNAGAWQVIDTGFNMQGNKEVVANDAARYTLLPGENVLLELKVKSFGDDGIGEVNVQAIAKNPFSFITKIISKIKNLLTCSACTSLFCKKPTDSVEAASGGLFVVTSHRCFITKDYVENEKGEKKSNFLPLVVLAGLVAFFGTCILIFGNSKEAWLGIVLWIVAIVVLVFAFLSRNKKSERFLKEDHEFVSFPRSVLTEYNSFTCNKMQYLTAKTGCCGGFVAATAYKTVLTVGLNTKGEHCCIEPEKTLELVLDPEQVPGHEQALVVISKLAELAQKAQ